MIAEIWDAAGSDQVNNNLGQLTLTAGSTDYVLVGMPLTPFGKPNAIGFLDSRKVSVVYHPLSIQPTTFTGATSTDYTFPFVDNGLFIPGSVYTYDTRVGTNQTAATTTTANSMVFQIGREHV